MENQVENEGARRVSEPVFNIPGILVAFVGAMVAIHLAREYILSAELDNRFVMLMAFLPARYLYPLFDQDAGWFVGPVGYSFLHGGFIHLIFNCAWLLAFASPLAQRIGSVRFVVLWITSAVASAFFQAYVTDFANVVLIGASGVVSATFGAACRFSLPLSGTPAMRFSQYAPRLGIIEALTHRSVIMFIIVWALSNALVVYGAGVPSNGNYNVAWQAHVGGFLFGYLTFGLFDRKAQR
ncbi:rhomboid family intramembrane serine protease [Rhizobium sp. KVB221]|uniref:Rhomboid family intramembrane serine protease n=1 Tax=Rhizobium setariae TaxID=2801340 RepID=A0A937CLC6_9HYPH|nr:rhomboid family intramembrane serine protease [Rhizobium setariae]MBL0373040.1 rhomboid family intramembrane serine protease [Rhizobium setariae]